ncbi:hypothetical protein ACSBR1_002196 [Camellia fascicularis]
MNLYQGSASRLRPHPLVMYSRSRRWESCRPAVTAVAVVLPPLSPCSSRLKKKYRYLQSSSKQNTIACLDLTWHIDIKPNNVENDGGDCDWKSRVHMTFDIEQEAYDFYNAYGGRLGFSIRRGYVNKSKERQITSKLFVCNKEGFRAVDKKISVSQATEIDLAEKSGIHLNATFELMGNEASGRESLGFTKLDQKIYLRTKRQKSLAYREADSEEQITNIFWANAQMTMDYGQFGDVVTFDTTCKLNSAHRLFASFIGFNHHRETVIFGATLIYDETADSFIWLFRRFLDAMSSKAPKIIFTDQDAAMAKAIPIVMPNTKHRLCTWHLMQNALWHANSIFKDKELTFGVKEKWGWPYVRNAWDASMSSTQLGESFNAFLKDFIQSDHNVMQFFMHFDQVLCEKRNKELQAKYALCQKLLRVNIKVKIMEHAADIYTTKIYEEFQDEYVKSLEVNIEETEHDGESTVCTILDNDGVKVRKVRVECDGSLTYNCRKFEIKGILYSHCLKILRDTLKFKEIPSQYILKK